LIHVGDVVQLILSKEGKAKKKVEMALIIGSSETSGNLTAACLSTDVDLYRSKRFTEILLPSDLKKESLLNTHIILLDRIITVNPEQCKKIASLKGDKLDSVLRAFCQYAAYSYYKGTAKSRKRRKYISPSGKTIDDRELSNMIEASLDMWLTAGRFHDDFENRFAQFLGVKHVMAVNSGSSANLVAISTLLSHRLRDRRLKPGDEVITVAVSFPTTVAPIIQNNLIPVLVDVLPGTYNIDPSQIESAITERTRAIFLAHTLGNPFDIDKILELRHRYNLFLIEDNCDALGSRYSHSSSYKRYTGTFGDIATFSFYPAHHITTGEGGAVVTNDSVLYEIMLSIRDWGRDCWCPTGRDNTCGRRFSRQHGKLPSGYDHKYVYSHLGYNLKMTDWQAAIGLAQLQKLRRLLKRRKENFTLLYNGIKQFKEYFILPQSTDNSDASWFGFPITVKERGEFNKINLVKFLEKHGIGTRQLFAGNILRQPAFVNNKIKIRIGNSKILLSNRLTDNDYKMLPNTDLIMSATFWIGIWPGLNREKIEYIIQKIKEFITIHG
jgi:CDP-6-deoxy-D-xylo-4-hexulose-3-dehydrase